MTGVVIIGAGQAGIQLASSLRERGYIDRVVLVGDEVHPPYQRPPLSKAFLSGAAPEEMLFMQGANFFTDQKIEFRGGDAAEAIDRDLKQVTLRSGAFITYDHLVLATGTRNRTLPRVEGEMAGVLSLRTIEDARALKESIGSAQRIVVVGAGFLGLEAATIANAAGRNVRVIEAGKRALGRVASEPVSTVVRLAHEERGIRFDFDEAVVAIHGEGMRVSAVEIRSGEHVAADLVLVAIGVVPNAELAAAAGLTVHNGVVVDQHLQTEDPAISAIGDCASFPFAADNGRMVRLESVQNAIDHARCVADRITGHNCAYDQVPLFWSDQAGLRLQMAGITRGGEEGIVRGDPAGSAFSVFCYRGARLVAVESVSRLPDHMVARRLLSAGISPSRLEAADPMFDLKSLLEQRVAA